LSAPVIAESRPSRRARARGIRHHRVRRRVQKIRRSHRVLVECSQHPRRQVGLAEIICREFGLDPPGCCRSLRTSGAHRRRRPEIENAARSRIPPAHRGECIGRSCPGIRERTERDQSDDSDPGRVRIVLSSPWSSSNSSSHGSVRRTGNVMGSSPSRD
jgi:hypothetical protein